MTLFEIVQTAEQERLTLATGQPVRLELLPGMSEPEIAVLDNELPYGIPPQVREVLSYCRGFKCPLLVDLSGISDHPYDEALPTGHPIATDGGGNSWVVDFQMPSPDWGPIYFVGQDPPVILLQSPSLEDFFIQLFARLKPPYRSTIDDVMSDELFNVWRTNPGVLEHEEALASPDPEIASCARDIGADWQFVDLRGAPIGMGFSWGRYGPLHTQALRCAPEPIFAYQRVGRAGIFERLFKRKRV